MPTICPPFKSRRSRSGAHLLLRGVVALFASLPSVAIAQSSDVVRCKGGATVEGRVERETYRDLVIAIRRGVTRTIDWEDVQAVDFSGSQPFQAALADAAAGRFDDAIAAFDALAKDASLRRPLRQESLFELACLEQRRDDVDAAIAAYRELLKEFPHGRHLDAAAEGIVDCLLRKRSVDEALHALNDVQRGAESDAAGAGFGPIANALRGRILAARGKFRDARTAYEIALGDERVDGDLRAETQLGVARCVLASGNAADAQKRLRDLTTRAAPDEVLAGAWNDLADLEIAEAVAQRDAARIRIALYSYLRGVVLYVPRRGDRSAEHERALAGAARAFEYLSQLDSDPKSKRINRWRAEDLRKRLRR